VRTRSLTIRITSSTLGTKLTLSVTDGWQITSVVDGAGIDLGATPTSFGEWILGPTPLNLTVTVRGASVAPAFLDVYTTNGDGDAHIRLN
jgi:hypothetical protein